jgi:hypothetical protein
MRIWRWKFEGHTEEIEDTAGVAPLIVIPRYELHEVVVEGDTCLGVEDRAMWVTVQIAGDEVILGVGKYSYNVSALLILAYVRKKILNLPLSSPSAAALMVALISS